MSEPAEAIPLRVIDRETALRPENIPADVFEFLKVLNAPSLISVSGCDPTRTRVVSTLLHGNEPSGVAAIHTWLRSGTVPAVNVLFFVAAVRTALEPPGFANRFLPGRVDLNRCWRGTTSDRTGRFAADVLRRLREAEPESLIDIHNNTGHSPSYGVGPATGPMELQLAALFSDRFVRNDLDLGTLVEATRNDFPSISIECGRAGDPVANENARAGLERYLAMERLTTTSPTRKPMTVYIDPIRVEIRAGVELAFGEDRIPGADFTIARDIDRHNFEWLDAGAPIGWLGPNVERPLVAVGREHEDISDEYFAARNGVLETRRPLIPIMMTTNRRNALDDCLFYAVRRAEVS